MKNLWLVWSNLKRRKLRTGFTIAAIAVAFLLFGLLIAAKRAFTGGVELAGQDRLVVQHKVSIVLSMPISYGQRIATVPGVAAVTHSSWMGGSYQDPKNVIGTFPVDMESYLAIYPEIHIPEDQRKALMQDQQGAAVGVNLATRFNWKVGDTIPIRSTIYRKADGGDTWDLNVRAIYDADEGFDRSSILMHYDYFNESLQYGRDKAGWYIVKVADPANAAQVARDIDALFENSPAETKTSTEKAFAQSFAQQIGDIGAIVTAVLGCRFLFHAAGDGDDDGPGRARAHPRAGGAEDARLRQWSGDAPGAGRVLDAGADRGAARAWTRVPAGTRADGRAPVSGRLHPADVEPDVGRRIRACCWVSWPGPCRPRRHCACASSTPCGGPEHAYTVPGHRHYEHEPAQSAEPRSTAVVAMVGIAGVVAVLLGVLSIREGFNRTLQATGSADMALVMRAGSNSEMSSIIPKDAIGIIEQAPGVAHDAAGRTRVARGIRRRQHAQVDDQYRRQRSAARRGGQRHARALQGPHRRGAHVHAGIERADRRSRRREPVRRAARRGHAQVGSDVVDRGRDLRGRRRTRGVGDLGRRACGAGRLQPYDLPDRARAADFRPMRFSR